MAIEIFKNPDVMKVINEGVEKFILETCAKVREQAVKLAPEDTANLKNSIVYRTSTGGIGTLEGQPTPRKMEGYVGVGAFYGVYQEFGTRKMKPQPYLRPAIAIKALGQAPALVNVKIMQETARGKLTPQNIKERERFV